MTSPAGIVRVRDCLVTPGNRLIGPSEATSEMLDELAFQEIDELAATDKFNEQVLQYYQAQAAGRRSTLVFSKDLQHVAKLLELMAHAGIQAKAVIGKTSAFARQDNVASFERGDCAVLITCLALLEGYDAPHVSVFASVYYDAFADPNRLTVSSSLSRQTVLSSTLKW